MFSSQSLPVPTASSLRSLPTGPVAPWTLDLGEAVADLRIQPQGPALDLRIGDSIVAEVRLTADQPLGDPELADAIETTPGRRAQLRSPFGELAVTVVAGAGGTLRLDLWSETAKPAAWTLRLQTHHPLVARSCRFEQPDTLWLEPTDATPWTAGLRWLSDAVPSETAADDFGVALRFPRGRQFVLSLNLAVADGKATAARRAVDRALDAAFHPA